MSCYEESKFLQEWKLQISFRGVTTDGYELANGFIDHLYRPLRTTSNYSATDTVHNAEIATAPAKPSQSS
jgi:hypothetical protein